MSQMISTVALVYILTVAIPIIITKNNFPLLSDLIVSFPSSRAGSMRYHQLSTPQIRMREFCKHHRRHPSALGFTQRIQ